MSEGNFLNFCFAEGGVVVGVLVVLIGRSKTYIKDFTGTGYGRCPA